MYWEEIELEKTLGPGGEIRAVQRDKKNISKWEKLKKQLRRDKWMYLLLLPGIIMTFIFKYVPMYGAVIAFKDYNPMLGILESPWVGLDHFREFISSPNFTLLLSNTLKISIYGLLLGFFPPIILALSLNQIINKKIKQKIQLILYAPNFISVVIIVGMLFLFLSANGPINGLVEKVTGQPIMFMSIQLISERFIFYLEFGKESAGHPFFTPRRWRESVPIYMRQQISMGQIFYKRFGISICLH